MSIELLKEKLQEHNESINALWSNISSTAEATIYIKEKLLHLGEHSERAAFNGFMEAKETEAELAAHKPTDGTARTLADHLSAIRAGYEAATANGVDTILTAFDKFAFPKEMPPAPPVLRFSHKAADDLGVDDSDVEQTVTHYKDDPIAVTMIYERPDNEKLIVEAVETETEDKQGTAEATVLEKTDGTQESFALNIILNEKQLHAKEMALAGKNYVLIGPAGSGKTTAQRSVAEALLLDKRLGLSTFKTYDPMTGSRIYKTAPSIAFVSYTRRAAANLAKAILKSPILASEIPYNIMTIHALLEFEPEVYFDAIEAKEKFRFAPKRTASTPLDITHLVIEESSMLGLDLWAQLYDALPDGVQIIFIGDINQLPPVFGPSILNYALVQLPIVELTETYRNQGVVLENAHHILKGEQIEENEHFTVLRGKSPVAVGQQKMSFTLGAIFKQLSNTIDPSDGLPAYDPEDCIILSPFNKQDLGTDNMNKWIAQFLGEKRGAIVHEVIAGFNKLYLAEGDKVMFNKRDCVITELRRNSQYHGKDPQLPGSDMTRFGVRVMGAGKEDTLEDISLDYAGFSLEDLENEKAERKQQCSHAITVTYDDGSYDTLTAAGDMGATSFSLGYALTVHKAQGSEWRKVFLILHKDHAIALYRELFYTAVTRARTKVTIIAKDPTIQKAIKNQRIKGNNLADKLEYFNSGADMRDGVYASKE